MVTFEKIAKPADNEASELQRFLILFLIGFFIIFVGIIILVVAVMLSGGSVNFGAIIFIGPFPIVVGIGPQGTWMILFAIILAVLSIIIFLQTRVELKTCVQLVFSSLP